MPRLPEDDRYGITGPRTWDQMTSYEQFKAQSKAETRTMLKMVFVVFPLVVICLSVTAALLSQYGPWAIGLVLVAAVVVWAVVKSRYS